MAITLLFSSDFYEIFTEMFVVFLLFQEMAIKKFAVSPNFKASVRKPDTRLVLDLIRYAPEKQIGWVFDDIKRKEQQHDKTNKMSVCPAKTQISLGIRQVWSESSLCTQWVPKDPRFLQADLSLGWAHTHFVGFVMLWFK